MVKRLYCPRCQRHTSTEVYGETPYKGSTGGIVMVRGFNCLKCERLRIEIHGTDRQAARECGAFVERHIGIDLNPVARPGVIPH